MMKKLASALLLMGAASCVLAPAAMVSAETNPTPSISIYKACEGNSDNEICKNQTSKVEPLFKKVVSFLMLILGIISVVMIVVGGFMYVTSSGDTNKTTAAKNTIIYAVVGVVVALLAYTIVNFAFNTVTK